ncbi:RNA 3'-terminal phosphate cyclase-like protein [Leptotrombidium deliense]|uniref:RNA 3'-terminal phosphate cyclase n=1 Tax=Leptotrombidium deliense TaxID=299467 RepID=A0A443ST73_9ACAR|nr:RNA 3'-terminal phosphate cyclase-like protein [Leptotrombidium deliense]
MDCDDKNEMAIDGRIMEGGGQILRISVALSSLTKKPISIANIRGNREKPGLRAQHLNGIKLVSDITAAKMNGCELGSCNLSFAPRIIKGGKYYADTGTAGSVVLLLQVSLPVLLFAEKASELILKGGTNADLAPQIDTTISVFKPIIQKMGVSFECNVIRRGYFPKGGGHVVFKVNPIDGFIKPIVLLDAGHVTAIKGYSYVAGVLPIKLAHEIADSAVKHLKSAFNVPIKIDRVKESSEKAEGNGSGIVLVAETSTGCIIGSSAIGSRAVKPDKVGLNAADELISELKSGGCVDSHIQDQLIIFMALAKGKSKIKSGPLTLHTKTAIHFCELLTNATFNVSEFDEGLKNFCIIECDGIGMNVNDIH